MIEANSPPEMSQEKLPNGKTRIKIKLDVTCDGEEGKIIEQVGKTLLLLKGIGLLKSDID